MDVILKVLEGAKIGTKIAVKKDEFLIGRSQKCQLCAGSSSVSRRHCAITRKDATVSIQDLGSRNGTLVNGEKIAEEVGLSTGDEIGIGSLKLLVTITHGITNLKRPKVATVADAVDRAATSRESDVGEEDITQWLLDAPSSSSTDPSPTGSYSTTQAANETQTIRMDDTNAIELKKEAEKQSGSAVDAKTEPAEGSDIDPTQETLTEEGEKSGEPASKKKGPGKLPPIPTEPGSKDSREAAMQALRNWNRRR